MSGSRVFVLGGGVAGLGAAFGLAERGHAVTLLESRQWLGGRAFTSFDRVSDRWLDNGPHVMLGCYRAMRALLRRLGTEDGFQQDASLRLGFRLAGGRRADLQLGRLPVPLAMPIALFGLPMPFGARLRGLLGMGAVLRGARADWTLADWFVKRGQQGEPAAFLWRPLCRAIMNCDPEQACAADFLATLREAFLGSAARAAFWVPKRPWRELVGEPALPALARAGVTVRLGARVKALSMRAGAVDALVLGDGERIELRAGHCVVSALPWFVLAPLLAANDHDAALPFAQLRSAPIVTAYVTLAAVAPPLVDDGPVVGMVGGAPFDFLLRTPGGDPRQVAMLAGGERSFDGQTVDVIAQRALEQLQRYVPEAVLSEATVRVRKEQHATFVPACGSAAARPLPGRLRDGPSNLRICGDWTATGFPATLEGAARSAEALLRAWI